MNDHEFVLHAELEDEHWWFRARREIIIDRLLNVLPPGHDQLVVEIGCGTGGNLKALSRHYNVMGIDLSPAAVAFASERVTCPVHLGDFRDILRKSWAQVDGVVLADVLEHVEDDTGFAEDLIQALKPGAVLIITVPALRFLWSRHDVVLGHVRRYQKDDFRKLWERLPVQEQVCSYFNSILFPAIGLARLAMGDSRGKHQESSSLKAANPILNALLFNLFSMEKYLLRSTPLPIGVSLMAVLKKL